MNSDLVIFLALDELDISQAFGEEAAVEGSSTDGLVNYLDRKIKKINTTLRKYFALISSVG